MAEDIIQRAINFATHAHRDQKRKFGDRPYITHPINVAEFVAILKDSSNADILIAAAILHDVIEDTEFNYDQILMLFGYKVADLVEELTNDKELAKFEGKELYLLKKMVGMSSYALAVKLCDILHNLTDLREADAEFRRNFIKRASYCTQRIGLCRPLTDTHNKLLKAINLEIDKLEKMWN